MFMYCKSKVFLIEDGGVENCYINFESWKCIYVI